MKTIKDIYKIDQTRTHIHGFNTQSYEKEEKMSKVLYQVIKNISPQNSLYTPIPMFQHRMTLFLKKLAYVCSGINNMYNILCVYFVRHLKYMCLKVFSAKH